MDTSDSPSPGFHFEIKNPLIRLNSNNEQSNGNLLDDNLVAKVSLIDGRPISKVLAF